MCTVSVVPLEDGFRLAFNRDERRERPSALAPAIHHLHHQVAVFPVDPLGGGTWIGVNDLGLAAALLNRTTGANVTRDPRRPSRGLLIPRVLESQSLAEALDACVALEPSRFNFFRLLLVHDARVVVVTSSYDGVSTERIDLTRPCMLTSSSLGDDVVEAPRQQLFEQMFRTDEQSWLSTQARFHSHRWQERPEISVSMARADAKTVSQAFVTVSSNTIQFRYRAFGRSNDVGMVAA